MKRVNTRTQLCNLAMAAMLFSGVAHAANDNAPAQAELHLSRSEAVSLAVVWDELKVGGDKSFNAFIQGNPALAGDTGNDNTGLAARPAPSLLWVLGAGIIGLATVARRRSHH